MIKDIIKKPFFMKVFFAIYQLFYTSIDFEIKLEILNNIYSENIFIRL